jgi:predicted alpha-1,2-mannosidase
MIGYHAVPVIYDAYKKGLTNVNPKRIYEAMKKSAFQDTFGLNHFRKYGYIPSELEREAVSKTLEYSYDDWCIAQMAKELGNEKEYKYFLARSNAYESIFDSTLGFMRGKYADGQWIENFSPTFVSHRRSDYTEANAWQYTWHVLHDPDGLIKLFGGKDSFIMKLDSLFEINSDMEGDISPDISGLIGQYAHGNEPCHHIPYLYSAADEIDKAAFRINQIRNLMYDDNPAGLIGNDDCGQMSAWFVFSSIGFYPLNPADGKYWFGTPKFQEVEIELPEGKSFKITSENLSAENIYIKSIELNGSILDGNYITHSEIMNGGNLIFRMGEQK